MPSLTSEITVTSARMRGTSRGFTLVEVLVVIAVTSVLASLVMVGVTKGRSMAREVECCNNLRQLGLAAKLYANNYDGHFPPLGYSDNYPTRYWWGTNEDPPDYEKGFLAPYLGKAGKDGGVYQCPEQPPGTYSAEGIAGAVTTTYGYNGYYLCPPAAPGWNFSIGRQPWQTFQEAENQSQVFMFADALLNWGTSRATNTSFLDPPFVYSNGAWRRNPNPTTCFRHSGRANVCFVDGHVEAISSDAGTLTAPGFMIGYVGDTNAPHYVPNYRDW